MASVPPCQEPGKKKLKPDSVYFCPHCEEDLSWKTYSNHRGLFFDSDRKKWIKSLQISAGITPIVPAAGQDDSTHPSLTSGHGLLHAEQPSTDESPPPSPIELLSFHNTADVSVESEVMEPPDLDIEDFAVNDMTPESLSTSAFPEPDHENDIEPSDELEDLTFSESYSSENGVVMWTITFLLQLQVIHGISDRALDSIFRFLKTTLKVLSNTEKGLSIQRFMQVFPGTLYSALKCIHLTDKQFKKYPVCPECKSVYSMDECIEVHGNIKKARKCRNKIGYKVCDTDIVSAHQSQGGKVTFSPLQTFCYNSVAHSIVTRLTEEPGLLRKCNDWRQSVDFNDVRTPKTCLSDIYDASVWREACESFLQTPNNLVLQLNVDWFQPYEHIQYSVGAMYLAILNLPFAERYKTKNVFLVGIIPGPDEPKHDINQFLRPLIDDLLLLWEKGVSVKSMIGDVTVKCMLGCLACDIPAARKVAGFIGHSGRLGCSKCKKEFLYDSSLKRLNYSGFDRDSWPKRTNYQHRQDVQETLRCKSKTERERKESEVGCRYSALLDLPYFDPVRMTVIDPMHNLFLGTAKHFMGVLTATGKLSKDALVAIQKFVEMVVVPDGVGRIPRKIESGFSGLTADQWKNWTTIYSIPALKPFLSSEVLECWRHYVLACQRYLNHELTTSDLQLADALMLRFCTRFEALFDAQYIKPNMHLHAHLKECVTDFGPLRNFWLFAYERYNGIVGSVPTNHSNIEPQLMQKFLRHVEICQIPLPEIYSEDFLELMPDSGVNIQTHVANSSSEVGLQILAKPSQDMLDSTEYKCVCYVCNLIEGANMELLLASSHAKFNKYPFIHRNGRKFGSMMDRRKKRTVVLARWPLTLYGVPTSADNNLVRVSQDITGSHCLRPFVVSYYIEVPYTVDGQGKSCIMAKGVWPKYSPVHSYFGKPYSLWCSESVETNSRVMFINVDQIVCNCAHFVTCVCGISTLCICPITF